MANNSNNSAAVIAPVNKPAVMEAHEADKLARAAVRDNKRKKLIRCLDPETAAAYEARKPIFEWLVKCSYMKPQPKGGLKEVSESDKVVAKDEHEAWATFCDKFDLMISRKACLECTIKQLEKRTLDNDE